MSQVAASRFFLKHGIAKAYVLFVYMQRRARMSQRTLHVARTSPREHQCPWLRDGRQAI